MQGNSQQSFFEKDVTKKGAIVRIIAFLALFLILVTLSSNLIVALNVDLFSFAGRYAVAVGELLALVIAVLSIFVVYRGDSVKLFRSMGFFDKTFLLYIAIGFVAGVVLIGTMFGGMFGLGAFTVTAVNHGVDLSPALFLFFLVACVEEIVFRGFILITLERAYGTFVAIVVSSLIF